MNSAAWFDVLALTFAAWVLVRSDVTKPIRARTVDRLAGVDNPVAEYASNGLACRVCVGFWLTIAVEWWHSSAPWNWDYGQWRYVLGINGAHLIAAAGHEALDAVTKAAARAASAPPDHAVDNRPVCGVPIEVLECDTEPATPPVVVDGAAVGRAFAAFPNPGVVALALDELGAIAPDATLEQIKVAVAAAPPPDPRGTNDGD